MSPDIPDYYRHLLESSTPPDPPQAPPPQQTPNPMAPDQAATPRKLDATINAMVYRANTFTLHIPEAWQDNTIYQFAGPIKDDIPHALSVAIDRDVPVDALLDYVDWHLMTLETNLQSYHLLKRGSVTLQSGMPAYRVTCRWSPIKERPLYQEQLYVLQKQVGYRLTATFTKKTRKTLRPEVERMMLRFEPFG